MPDSGMVFDVLFARAGEVGEGREGREGAVFKKHPGGLSSLFFAFANLVIHSLFNTSPSSPPSPPNSHSTTTTTTSPLNYPPPTTNTTSSYLDLSPLYGTTPAQLASVRRFDGTGRLWEDCWADERIGYMPPSSVGMVVVFCRNHNVGCPPFRFFILLRTGFFPSF